ncbi:MAG: Asp23/Gls24 family envelope stress response protein [Lachnospiraceae bacterium]|nr:Asp23/Gls24 family envelope stress response protein [Lachnospiraceae bacterium]
MAKDMGKGTVMQGDTIGRICIAGDVVSNIAGIAATEVEGVAATVGNVTNELMSKVGIKTLNKAIKVEINDRTCKVMIGLIMKYGYHIPTTCKQVQDKVRVSIENMTGLVVEDVSVRVEGIDMSSQS